VEPESAGADQHRQLEHNLINNHLGPAGGNPAGTGQHKGDKTTMKKLMVGMIAAAMALLVTLPAQAAWTGWHPIPSELRGAVGATHVAEFKFSDMSEASTNTIEYFTNSVAAGTMVQCKGMVLEKAFESTDNSNICRVAFFVGDGSTTNLYLDATEIASDGTELFTVFPPYSPSTVAVTLNTVTQKFMCGDGTTNFYTVATGTTATATATLSEYGYKENSSAGKLVFAFMPNADDAMDAMTQGVVRVYFRLIDNKSF
jgi:hypothetical protein